MELIIAGCVGFGIANLFWFMCLKRLLKDVDKLQLAVEALVTDSRDKAPVKTISLRASRSNPHAQKDWCLLVMIVESAFQVCKAFGFRRSFWWVTWKALRVRAEEN